jgi:hypothetical protein
MALAERTDANRWRLSPHMTKVLTDLGEREDAQRLVRVALRGARREVVLDPAPTHSIVGRLAAKGLLDELHDVGYLVVDGMDGRAHFVRVGAGFDLESVPLGGIVEVRPAGQARMVDRQIQKLAVNGIYRSADHRALANRTGDADPETTIEIHKRRLEALARGGVVERVADGVWRVPEDMVERAQQFDRERSGPVVVDVRSRLALDRQVRAVGATWLDAQLLRPAQRGPVVGFAEEVRQVIRQRAAFLVEIGLAEHRGDRIVVAKNLLSNLRARDVADSGRRIQEETGRAFRAVSEGQRVTGIYARAVQLASGRYAMLQDGDAFSLVPWKPMLEERLGQRLSAIVRDGRVDWTLSRQRGLGL